MKHSISSAIFFLCFIIPNMTAAQSLSMNTICKRESAIGTVVFIHGWNGDAQTTWNNFPHLICSDNRF